MAEVPSCPPPYHTRYGEDTNGDLVYTEGGYGIRYIYIMYIPWCEIIPGGRCIASKRRVVDAKVGLRIP